LNPGGGTTQAENRRWGNQGLDTRAHTQKTHFKTRQKTAKNPAQNNQILMSYSTVIFYQVERCKCLRNKFSELLNITEIKDHYWSAVACK